ncbi:MAG: J domain-containing protein [Sphingomonadales bacterium]|nr:J domain-containing protein [Sphingomonadales bacterium]MDE2567788.1 J domain-containing protein [Sphingomonadales bacterium]
MARIIWFAALAVIAVKLLSGHWPWDLLKAADRNAAASRARAVLGVRPEASREEIVEAHRRRLIAVHPDRGGSLESVHEADAARDLLLARLAERR